MARYYADFAVGDSWHAGPRSVTATDIVDFAEQFDPLPMHVDRDNPGGHVDDVIASGWHTAAITMRLMVDAVLEGAAVIAGIGADELRWPTPVRPGDALSVSVEVVDRDPVDEDRGRIDLGVTTSNQDGDVVLSMVTPALFERRRQSS